MATTESLDCCARCSNPRLARVSALFRAACPAIASVLPQLRPLGDHGVRRDVGSAVRCCPVHRPSGVRCASQTSMTTILAMDAPLARLLSTQRLPARCSTWRRSAATGRWRQLAAVMHARAGAGLNGLAKLVFHLRYPLRLRTTRSARDKCQNLAATPAQRSVCTWCFEPVSQLDPRLYEHFRLLPGSSDL